MELKEIRKENKISQKEASLFLGIPLRTYIRYENNESYKKTYKYLIFTQALVKFKKKKLVNKSKISKSLKIVVAGAGYVGLANACLLADANIISITDIDANKIKSINNGNSPFKDRMIDEYLLKHKINSFLSNENAYSNADIVIVATPTDFNKKSNKFDTSSIENVIELVLSANKKSIIVIKSTIPIGYIKSIINRYHYSHFLFSPEFLREGQALYDSLHPSRIIVGYENNKKDAEIVANLFKKSSYVSNVQTLLVKSEEAEAIKLFSNAYLAMRVSFFNEIDTFAEIKNIDSLKVISGVSLDLRIGNFYNNPSFGYGGYCLSKDTAQLAQSFSNISNSNLIQAIVKSNKTRKEFIANQIISKAIKVSNKKKENITIGVYLLSMKKNSDNYRSSSTLAIIKMLNDEGVKTKIFDPNYEDSEKIFDVFIKECDFFIANRYDPKLKKIRHLLYTRDLFNRD